MKLKRYEDLNYYDLLPEGAYLGVLVHIENLNKGERVRFTFELSKPISPPGKFNKYYRPRIRKPFDMELRPFGKLAPFLGEWRKRPITENEENAGRLALNQFLKKEGYVVVRHFQSRTQTREQNPNEFETIAFIEKVL